MGKFFGYSGLFCFFSIYILLSIKYYFYDLDVDIYTLCVAMGSMYLWFDYKIQSTVVRYIIELPYKEDDGDEKK